VSLKKNIAANYFSQIYLAIISIVTLPQLVKVLGAEGYGLVAFFSLLQSWLILLDLGMSPTLAREISRYRGGAINGSSLLFLYRTLKKVFIGLSIVSAIIIVLLSDSIATRWLKTDTLPYQTVMVSIVLIGLIVSSRWILGIHKSAVNGFEKQVWLSGFNIISATLRFVAVFAVLHFFGNSVEVFFIYQFIISFAELIIISVYVKRLMPLKSEDDFIDKQLLKNSLRFALTIAFTGGVWIVSTQTDKLILSKMLLLSEFGYYTIGVQLAGGITLISNPISSALLPRLTKLEAEHKQDEFIGLYRFATQLIVVIVGAISLVLIFFARQVLFAWTGNPEMVEKVVPFVVLYATGNFILALAGFPYYLQYAKGNLRLHLYGNIGFIVFLLPALILMVYSYGGMGAGYTWIGVNLLFFLFWVPFVHNRFVKGLNFKWYLNDILLIVVPTTLLAFLLQFAFIETDNRIYVFLQLLIAGCLILFTGSMMSSKIRSKVVEMSGRIFSSISR